MSSNCKALLKIGKWLIAIFLILAIFLGLQYWFWLNRVHGVSQGQLYRSAQLSPSRLSWAIDTYKIVAVLNLRGEVKGESWYQQEREVARQKNVAYYTLPMNSYSMPSKAELLQLVQILESSPKPLLVHCEGGADRTGLAAAIYLILQNKSISEAKREYSLRYYVIHSTSVGKLVIPNYAAWLKKNNLASSKSNFLTWLNQT